ncbi:MAG TPA: protein kinase [Candidatus Acidoferrum sp.]|nr:protein kinase [Candidatus Acidoferrum sp.]
MIGQTVSRYLIVEKIGAGGMGVVYRAHDERLDRDVALKVLPAGTFRDEAARKRFRKEALALSKLNHPNIATIHDFDSQDGVDFLVMELISGTTLSHKLHDGGLSEKEVTSLGLQIASALEEAHEHGIVHRDLKPSNIFVTPKNQVKILDFGLAVLLKPEEAGDVTLSDSDVTGISGTLQYMAPEQLLGKPADIRSDIYAVGTILFEMATGQRPFEEKLSTALSNDIIYKQPPRPTAMRQSLSPRLEDIILKCLEKTADDRYQSAKELAVDLRRLSSPTTGVVAPVQPVRKGIQRWQIILALSLVLIAAGVLLVRYHFLGGHNQPIDSLAILPFENAGGNPDAEYLSDGLTESLINSVSQLPNLKVIARSSVFRYKGKAVDPSAVGRELSARAILTGRIVERGDDLSVSAELTDTLDNRHIWGEQYNVKLTDLLAIQQKISNEISSNLRSRLAGKEDTTQPKQYTNNADAFQLYLKGRFYSDQATVAGVQRGVEYFHQAIEKDPRYALAYVGIANAYFLLSSQFSSPREAMPKVKEAATKALQIDQSLAEAHTLLGLVNAFYDYDFPSAADQFKRGVELDPGSASAHQWRGYFLIAMAQQQEALDELTKAKELDPLSDTVSLLLSVSYLFSRQYDQSIDQSKKMIAAEPDFWWGHFLLGWAEAETGKYDEAIQALTRATQLDASPYPTAYLGYADARSGNKARAQDALHELEQKSHQLYVPRYQVAAVYVGLGEKQKAMECLQQAFSNREEIIAFLKVDPTWDSLRSESSFQSLLHRAGLN